MTTFGPQLIGQTEKALGAILLRALSGTGLDERQWVALRLAGAADGTRKLTARLHTRAHFDDAEDVVADLTSSGHLVDGRRTALGDRVVAKTQARITELSSDLWVGLDPADVAATERVLMLVGDRARAVLTRE